MATRILHASIPADDPERVARVLARITGGTAMPFPPGGPAAWIAWADDDRTEIEVVRRGDGLVRGPEEAEWRPGNSPARASEAHLALAVPMPSSEVLDVAGSEGWPARICVRGGLFELVEVWIEDAFMIEVFDPGQAERFGQIISGRTWATMLSRAPTVSA